MVESFLGDLMKVVAVQLDDMFERDHLQIPEIKALLRNKLLRHGITEVAPLKIKPRPAASKSFMKNYHSGNFYTLTKSRHEVSTRDRLDLIMLCYRQAHIYDGLERPEFYALCESYIDEHFDDGVEVGHQVPDRPRGQV